MTPRAVSPAGYDASDYPPFAVTVDVVVLTIRARELQVLLIERRDDPHAGSLALPGGFVRPAETLAEAAARELQEETGIDASDLPAGALAQLGAYGDPHRDPRMRVVSVAYLAIVRSLGDPKAGGDAADAKVMPVSRVLGRNRRHPLAFDHELILTEAVEQARQRLETTSLATAFVGPEFTLSELREVYEAAWGEELDPGNFRRKVLSIGGLLSPTGRRRRPGPEGGKPAEVYHATERVERLDVPIRRAAPEPEPGTAKAHHTKAHGLPDNAIPLPSRYPNDFGDDPWDNDAIHWLLDQPSVADEWSRQRLFEAMRRQKRLVDAEHPDIARAAKLAQRFGINQVTVSRSSGTITRLHRTDPEAPQYPSHELERRRLSRAAKN